MTLRNLHRQAAGIAILTLLVIGFASAAPRQKNAGPEPYQGSDQTKVEPTSNRAQTIFFEVPAGQMVRLQTVTGYCSTLGPTPVTHSMAVTVRANGQRAEFHIPPSTAEYVQQIDGSEVEQGALWNRSVNFLAALTAYAGPETYIRVNFRRSFSGYESFCWATVGGELLDAGP